MTIRLAKFYLAAGICLLALYMFWMGIEEWRGMLSATSLPLSAGTAVVLSLFGLGIGGLLGWKTVLEELSVRCD